MARVYHKLRRIDIRDIGATFVHRLNLQATAPLHVEQKHQSLLHLTAIHQIFLTTTPKVQTTSTQSSHCIWKANGSRNMSNLLACPRSRTAVLRRTQTPQPLYDHHLLICFRPYNLKISGIRRAERSSQSAQSRPSRHLHFT